MTHCILLAVSTLMLMPGGFGPRGDTPGRGAASPPKVGSPVNMTGTPLADSGLKDGTVSVRVVGSSFRDNLENVDVALYRLDAFEPVPKEASKLTLRPSASPVVRAKTGKDGRAFLNAQKFAGERVRLLITYKAMVQVGRSFAVPASGGLRFVFSYGTGVPPTPKSDDDASMVPGHPAADMEPGVSPPAVPGEPVVSVEYRVASVEAGKVALMVVYIFWNDRKRPMRLASGGVFIPHPLGLGSVSKGPHDPHVKLGKKGVTVFGRVEPGRLDVAVSGVMKFDHDSLRVRHRIPIKLRSFGIISGIYPNVRFLGAGLKPARLEEPDAARRYTAFRGPGGPPGTTIEFHMAGLPRRSLFWSKAAVALAVLLVLAALGRTLIARFKQKDAVGEKPASVE